MKKILFVAHHLTVGGVQKSLITALNAIDYTENEVTLYVRKNRTDLLSYINKNVHVIINDDSTRYYAKPKIVFLQIKLKFFDVLKKTNKSEQIKKEIADKIRVMQMTYEHNKYFSEITYDFALAYMQGYEAQFVNDYIKAEKKALFYQVSVDEHHDVHEKFIDKLDYILTEHPSISSEIKKWYPRVYENRFFIIENYTDYEFINFQAKEKDIPHDKFTICTCARMAPVKGYDIAVNAAKILRDKGFDFRWYFVGDGPERNNIEKMIDDYQLWDYVLPVGMQKNPYTYMNAADIYVLSSYEEAMSISVLEAMVLYKPVVTTKTVGGMNIVKDGVTGIQTDINAMALAEGILKISDKDMFNHIVSELKKRSLAEEKAVYMNQWKELLNN